DVGLDSTFGAAYIHCHGAYSFGKSEKISLRLLDEVVDQLRRGVRHLDVEVLEAAGEVVVEPHGRDGDDQTECGLDQGLREAAGDRGEAARARGGDAVERGDDADGRAEQPAEGSRRADGRQRGDVLLQVVGRQGRGALNGAADRVDHVIAIDAAARFLL